MKKYKTIVILFWLIVLPPSVVLKHGIAKCPEELKIFIGSANVWQKCHGPCDCTQRKKDTTFCFGNDNCMGCLVNTHMQWCLTKTKIEIMSDPKIAVRKNNRFVKPDIRLKMAPGSTCPGGHWKICNETCSYLPNKGCSGEIQIEYPKSDINILTSNPEIIIIISVCLPVLIILLVIGIIFYRRKKSSKNEDEVIDENPDYDYGEADDDIEIVDQNDYYWAGESQDEVETAFVDQNPLYGTSDD